MPGYYKCEKPYELILPDGRKLMVEVEIEIFMEVDKNLNTVSHYNVADIKLL